MSLNWNVVLEFVIGGLILAMLAGVGALAFRDWRSFRRLHWRVIIATGLIGILAAVVFLSWVDINNAEITDKLDQMVVDGVELPGPIVETVKFNQSLRDYLIKWVLYPGGIIWLYFGVIYLFARPVPDAAEKKKKRLKQKQSALEAAMSSVQKLTMELSEAEVKLAELKKEDPEKTGQ